MARILYEEEQRFSNVWWTWVLQLVLLFLTFVLILTDENTEGAATKLLLTVSLGFLPIAVIIYHSKLQFKIDEKGIHYKFFPAVFKWKIIPGNTIKSFEVSGKRNLFEKLGRGYTRNRLDETVTMNISGSKLARIKLKNGRTFNIGTENPENLERALKKLTTPDNY